MNGQDAFEEEMLFRTLSDADAERLLCGRAPEGSEFAEVAEFAQAVRQTLPVSAAHGSAVISQLAEAARVASAQSATETAPATAPARGRRFRLPLPRLVAIARATAIVALVPLLFAGLAIAGVSLPEPARDAFKAAGVDLPNQPADDGKELEQAGGAESAEDGEGDGSTDSSHKAKQKDQGLTANKRGRGTEQANPARAGGRANGEQGRGRALGKRGLAPGQVAPPGQQKKDAGGTADATPPGQSSKPGNSQDTGKPLDKGTAGNGRGGEKSTPKPAKSPKG